MSTLSRMGTIMNPQQMPQSAPSNDALSRARMAQMAMQMMGGNRRPTTPVAAGIDGLARILMARQLRKGEEEQMRQQQAQREADIQSMSGLQGAENPLELIARINSPELQRLASSFYQQSQNQPERRVIADATGRQRYADTGELVFPDVDTSVLVSPREKLDLEGRKIDATERNANLRENELELDRDEQARKSEKLSAAAEKRLMEYQDSAFDAGRSAASLDTLASDFEAMAGEIQSGALGNAREAFKKISGSEDSISILRTRYAAIRNSQAVKNLPPGVASDKDIAMALEGFLPVSADPNTVASFLRGMSKMERFEEQFSRFAANYIDQERKVGGLLDAWDKSPELKSLVADFGPKSEPDEFAGKSDEELMAELEQLQNGG